jgi:1-deoxy-D-xylulose-5-phosphate synthase
MYKFGKKIEQGILQNGVKATTINARFIKPLDADMLTRAKDKFIIVLEDNVENGGLYQSILSFYSNIGIAAKVKGFSLPTMFLPCGKAQELMDNFGFNYNSALSSCLEFLK